MNVTVDANELKMALRRLQPARRYKSMREDKVTATAGGNALVLMGTLDSSASITANVLQAGTAALSIDQAIKLLGTYGKSSTVTVRKEADALYFDKLRFPA